jgi:hypothetical protein
MNKKVLAALVSTLAFGTVSVAKAADDKPAPEKKEVAKKGGKKGGEKGDKGDKGDKKGEKSCKGDKGDGKGEKSCKGDKAGGAEKSCGAKSCSGKK